MERDRNYALFYALLKKMPGDVTKEELVHKYTNGRTLSLRDMSDREYHSMISLLKRIINDPEELRRSRSVVLRLMQSCGINTSDWDEVDRFCSHSRIAGKVFRKMTIAELNDLSIKLRAMKKKGYRHKSNLLVATRHTTIPS